MKYCEVAAPSDDGQQIANGPEMNGLERAGEQLRQNELSKFNAPGAK